jgi:hypothetical protein
MANEWLERTVRRQHQPLGDRHVSATGHKVFDSHHGTIGLLSFHWGCRHASLPTEWHESTESTGSTLVLRDPGLDSAFCVSVIRAPQGVRTPRAALATTQCAQEGHIHDLENRKALLTHSFLSEGGATETRVWHLALDLIPSGILDEQIRGRPVILDTTDCIKSFRGQET